MKHFLRHYSRTTLVVTTTAISIAASLLILFTVYSVLGVQVRQYEIIIATVAPLLIASPISWYLYSILKKLEQLEHALRQSISKEKEQIYLASIQSAQHVVNNLLNQLKLVELEIQNHPDFDQEVARLYGGMLEEATGLMKQLSSVKQIEAKEIIQSVSPTNTDQSS